MGTISDKLVYLNETKQDLKNVINYAGAGLDSSTAFRNYSEKLYDSYIEILKDDGEALFNEMPKQSIAAASYHTINDTIETKMTMDLDSIELEQATTLGLNYFNANAISNSNIIVNDNGKTILLPIATSGVGMVSTGKTLAQLCPDLEVGSTYYLNASRNLGSAYNTYIYLSTSNYLWSYSGSRTITQNDLNSTVALYGNNYVNGETSQCILNNFRITKNNADSWEQFTFGASPNPQYPQEIHTISGDNEVVISNKNLAIENFNTKLSITGSGQNRTVVSSDNYSGLIIKIKPNTSYTISGDFTSLADSNMRVATFTNYPNVGDISLSHAASANSIELTTPQDANYLMLYNANKTINTIVSELFVCETIYATTYVPHEEQVLSLNLPVKNLFDKTNPYVENWYDTDGVEHISSLTGHCANNIPVKENTTYTMSGYKIIQGVTQANFQAVYFYDSNGDWISRTAIITTKPYTFTTPANCRYIKFQLSNNTGAFPDEVYSTSLDTFQLEEGTKANSYTPYGTEPLEVCKIGDYEDEFYKATESDTGLVAGKWYLKKNTIKVERNVSDMNNWENYPGWVGIPEVIVNSFPNKNTYMKNIASYLCNCEPSTSKITLNTIQTGGVIFLGKTDFGLTQTEWQTNYPNLKFVFEIGVTIPTYVLLNDTLQTQLNNIYNELILSYNEQTNISQINNDLPFQITPYVIKLYKNI